MFLAGMQKPLFGKTVKPKKESNVATGSYSMAHGYKNHP